MRLSLDEDSEDPADVTRLDGRCEDGFWGAGFGFGIPGAAFLNAFEGDLLFAMSRSYPC